jgi:hypothetical protein
MKLVLLFAALAAILMIIPASAAKPVPSGTIALDQSDPSLGDVVTFTTTTSLAENCNTWGGPRCYRIDVTCSQNAAITAENPTGLVYYGDANAGQQFLLGGGISDWVDNGGPADCVARLFTYTAFNPVTRYAIASVAFAAGG